MGYISPWGRKESDTTEQLHFLPISIYQYLWASQVAQLVKNPPANAGDIRDVGLIPGSGRCPGGGHDNPLQYSYLENPTDREAWQATVHGVREPDMT